MKSKLKLLLAMLMTLALSMAMFTACGDLGDDVSVTDSTSVTDSDTGADSTSDSESDSDEESESESESTQPQREEVSEVTLGEIAVGGVTFDGYKLVYSEGVIGETQYAVTSDGKYLVIVTGVRNLDNIYKVGYDFGGYYEVTEEDKASTVNYYTSLTAGENTLTINDIFGENSGYTAMIIWQVAYDKDSEYAFYPYMLEGEEEDGKLYKGEPEIEISPDEEVRLNLANKWTEIAVDGWTFGGNPQISFKALYGEAELTYFDAEGEELEAQPENAGSYFVQAKVAQTVAYKGLQGERYPFTIEKATNAVSGMENVSSSIECHYALSKEIAMITSLHGEVDAKLYADEERTETVENVDELSAGTYYLVVKVDGDANHDGVEELTKTIMVKHAYAWENTDEADVYSCACGIGTIDFSKVVTGGERQFTAGESKAIDLTGAGKGTVVSVAISGEKIAESAEIDFANVPAKYHGKQTLVVTIQDEIGVNHEVNVPAFIITGYVTDVASFDALVPAAGKDVYGYYILSSDVDYSSSAYKGYSVWQDNAAYASFRGTLDGNGKTITVNTNKNNGGFGLLGDMNGATIKNLNIVEKGYDSLSGYRAVFGKAAYNTTFENINITITGAKALDDTASHDYKIDSGFITFGMSQFSTYRNINIYANNVTDLGGNTGELKMGSIIGKVSQPTYIDNVNVYAASVIEAYHFAVPDPEPYMGGEREDYPGTINVIRSEMLRVEKFEVGKIEGGKITLALTGYENAEIVRIFDANGDYTSLTLDVSGYVADAKLHGKHSVNVLVKAGEEQKLLVLPYLLVTKTITTVDDLIALRASANTQIYGYYEVANDIDYTKTSYGYYGQFYDRDDFGAFRGIFDGMGHTVTVNSNSNNHGASGLFGTLFGATIRNLNIVETNAAINYNNKAVGIFAKQMYNTEIVDVSITITGAEKLDNSAAYTTGFDSGLLAFGSASGNKLKNVTVYANSVVTPDGTGELHLGALLGKYHYITGASYENVVIYAASLAEVHHAPGGNSVTADELEGVTLVRTTKLEQQKINVENIADDKITLALGEENAEVEKVLYNGGVVANGLEVNVADIINDNAKHGENSYTVFYSVGGEKKVAVIPVLYITKNVATVADFASIIPTEYTKEGNTFTSNQKVYGYYVLTANLDFEAAWPKNEGGIMTAYENAQLGFNWANGNAFMGTLDGNGKTITVNTSLFGWRGWGMFGCLYSAVIKDLNIIENGYDMFRDSRAIFGKGIYHTTFSNIDITIAGEKLTATEKAEASGMFSFGTAQYCNFYDINIYANNVKKQDGTVGALDLGAIIGKAAAPIVIKNVNVYAASVIEAYHTAGGDLTPLMGRDTDGYSGFINVIVPEYLDMQIFAADEITDGKITLSFGKYEGTKEIDVSEVLEDKSKHGERMIADEYITVDGATKWVVVPYTVITKKIATAADLDALIPSAGTSVYGYYLLTADIDYTSTDYHGFFGGWDDTGAFRGTLDGNGKTITLNSKAHIGNGNGLFGKADGATVKNVNFVETGYDFTKRGRAVFAKAIYNTTFSDINFKITGAVDLNEELTSAISDDYGIFAFGTIQMCTFKNINIDASEVTDDKGATGPLQLGAVIGKAGGWIVIDNFSVYAAGVVEAYHMAQQADIHRMGRDDGAFKGFINVITPEKLDKQVFAVGEIENDTITLSLDKYNGGTVTKGTNVINVANVIADETKHGAEYTAVFYITVDGAEKWVVIPYSVVTAKIATAADFITIMPTAGSVTGYYYMTADVDLEAAWTNGVKDAYSNVQKGFSWASGNAFKGTLDGNGKTLTVNTYEFNSGANKIYNFAMFGALNGATIKNLNVTDKRFDCNASAKGLFAKGVYDTTFDNVNINIVGANALDEAITTVPGEDSGIFGFGTIQRATFKNITVNALDVTDASGARGPLNIGTVIGKVSAPVVIENFNVYAASVIEAYHLAGTANRHYLGRDGDGYKGSITVVAPETVAMQEFSASSVTDGKITLSLGDYTSATINKVYGAVNDNGTITVDVSAMLTDETKHGEGAAYVYVTIDGENKCVYLPYAIVTKYISTADDFISLIPTEGHVYGYYILKNDIDLDAVWAEKTKAAYDKVASTFAWGTGNAFKGTLNGNGKTVIARQYNLGMFSRVDGATIKNITFESKNITNAGGQSLLAKSLDGGKFLNITFNFPVIAGSAAISGPNIGYIAFGRVWGNTFRNVTVNSDGDLGSLLSTNFFSNDSSTNSNYFFDFVVNAKSLAAVGYNTAGGKKYYKAGNGSTDGNSNEVEKYGEDDYAVWTIRHVTLNVKA